MKMKIEKYRAQSAGLHCGPASGLRPGPVLQLPGRPDQRDALVRAVRVAAAPRLARARRRTRCGGGGSASTVGATTTRLTRWRWWGLT
jgi:hypothetical protein